MPTLDDIRDLCVGYSAIVMGSGPSLRNLRADATLELLESYGTKVHVPKTDGADPLRKHVLIAVNDALLKFPDADFYVTADGKMIYSNHWEVLRNSKCYAVLPDYAFNKKNMQQMGISTDRGVLFTRGVPDEKPRLLRTTSIFRTHSSAMAGVQLAVILGCSPIYLVGCEGMCEKKRKYFWEFPGQPGPGGTKAGFKTIWQQVHTSRGEKIPEGKYDETFDTRRGGVDQKTIDVWSTLSRTNVDLDLRNATGGLRDTKIPRVSILDILSNGILCTPRETGLPYWSRNTDVDRLRGAHDGRSALVMGAGPSMCMLKDRTRLVPWSAERRTFMLPDTSQPDRVHRHVTIAVNDAILKVPDADYYTTGDARMPSMRHWTVVIHRSVCKIVMPSFGLSRVNYYGGGVLPERLYIYRRRETAADWKVSRDSRFFLGELNSMHAGINLAVLMGCSPIYVIGCECRMQSKRKYFWELPGEPGPGGTPAGYATPWLEAEASRGVHHPVGTYDKVFDRSCGKILGDPGIAKWIRFAGVNPHLDIRDCCGSEWNTGLYHKASVEEMLTGG